MLASRKIREVAVPHEAGEWFKFRLLSWKQLDDARKARTREALANSLEVAKGIGPEMIEQIRASLRDESADAAPSDPLSEYDQATVLRLGVVAWSYEEPLTADALDELDEETARWAAREILRPAMRTEEDRLATFRGAAPGA